MIKRTTLLTLMGLGLLSMGITACNTVEGAGQDIENAGETVQDAAN
ncbi:MAG TPA: entericidin A/B family lipoprotein [Micavibrio sp.]|nr:entericidin A/B family lipoprotein [Pseudomonadota bacterium]HIF25186.1 entericidin A/B family lipoprotein [Micavibrio sp.]|tara:strand:- start:98 stop:235 length:138 start_codon:yes stop_codon:yes gene_type:complete